MITWPASLVEDIARRRAVLYVGAGASQSSVGADGKRPPSWRQFLTQCVARCEDPTDHILNLIGSGDLLTACELLKARLADDWNDILSAEFSEPQYVASDVHKSIHELDCRLVLTPNFDKIYDVYAQRETNGATKVKHYYDADLPLSLRKTYRSIVKVHGTIDEPSKTIFTRQEYARSRKENKAFHEVLDALFLTHTFVFIGSSLEDPDLRLFLEHHAYQHPGAPPHFITMPANEGHEEIDVSIRNNLNLRVLRYDPANDHEELVSSLGSLVPDVENARDELLRTRNW